MAEDSNSLLMLPNTPLEKRLRHQN